MSIDENILRETGAFIHAYIQEDLKGRTHELSTRFPPEPNGYIHIGNAKGVFINFEMAKLYGGKYCLRYDDTDPSKEEIEYVDAIREDIEWLGYELGDRVYFASDYFQTMYDCAIVLIKKGLAYVCDLSADEVKSTRGSLSEPGKPSPYRERGANVNLNLFTRMKDGEFADGARTLRAKIDMASPNMNMRDPVLYRIAHKTHYRTGDEWCVYPMYDFAHPLEDAIEGITHSMCSIEFEDHRPLYDWCVDNLDFPVKPRQIEFAKSKISNTVMGKRYLKPLVENGTVDGWDDPRMVTVRGMRRRGYPPAAIRAFLGHTGVSKSMSSYDFSLLEHYIREHLKTIAKTVMAVLDPIKIILTNYPEAKTETLTMENHPEDPEMGSREVPFSREIFIEREDFMEDPPNKFFRLSPGKEVRLKGAYFITCEEVMKDCDGRVTELRCVYDPETRSGSGFDGRKVKGTLHWVSAAHAVPITAKLFETLVTDAPETEEGFAFNPNSLVVKENAVGEPCLASAKPEDRFQFMRNGYFCLDEKDSANGKPAFNRTVSLRSSYKG